VKINTEKYGKVAVLMGGSSAERDISLNSGMAVMDALIRRDVNAHEIDCKGDVVNKLLSGDYDRAFIALHGRGGEDGKMQGMLEVLKLPYTGSGVKASAIAMDKITSKQIWKACGIRTPNYLMLDRLSNWESILSDLGSPVIIKPAEEGSSIGMTIASSPGSLFEAWEKAVAYDNKVFAEQWIAGKEYTASILNDTELPLIELKTPHEFYDYDAKYNSETTDYICPCELGSAMEEAYKNEANEAFKCIDGHGWGRVDFIVDQHGLSWFLEVNTVPGLTDHSLVPMAARVAQIGFDDLVLHILDTTIRV